jgi:single-strand DNA-binding protein
MSVSINFVILAGNLTRDVELRYTQGGTAIASFGLAVNKKYTSNGEKREQVSFFDVDAWGKTGELCSEYLQKGSGVIVQGELKQESWEQDGQKKYKVKVVANSVQFLPRSENGNSNGGNQSQGYSNQNQGNSGRRNESPF